MCVVGRNRSLRAAAARSNNWFDWTSINWKDYAKQSRKSDQNWSIGKASSSVTTTPDPTHLWWRQKLRELDWEVLMHPPYSPCHQTTICFDLYKTLWFQKKPVKITYRSFLSRNHRSSTMTGLWFYLKNGRGWSAHIWFNPLMLTGRNFDT